MYIPGSLFKLSNLNESYLNMKCLFAAFEMKSYKEKKSGKITSLAYIFTIEEARVKIIYGNEIIICQAIFQTFVVLSTTF